MISPFLHKTCPLIVTLRNKVPFEHRCYESHWETGEIYCSLLGTVHINDPLGGSSSFDWVNQ